MNEFSVTDLPQCYSCGHCGFRSSSFKAICPKCGSEGIVLVEATESGKIVDFVSVMFPPENLQNLGQYVSALVELDNGCRIFGIILENPENIHIGSSVVISDFNKDTKELYFKI